MNKCYNGGINYLQDTTLYKDCYGYDFKSFYPSILANEKLDFRFPIKKGYKKQFNSIRVFAKTHLFFVLDCLRVDFCVFLETQLWLFVVVAKTLFCFFLNFCSWL